MIIYMICIYPGLKQRFLPPDCKNGTFWKEMVKTSVYHNSDKDLLPSFSSIGNPKS
jgi:hypothetical protein